MLTPANIAGAVHLDGVMVFTGIMPGRMVLLEQKMFIVRAEQWQMLLIPH